MKQFQVECFNINEYRHLFRHYKKLITFCLWSLHTLATMLSCRDTRFGENGIDDDDDMKSPEITVSDQKEDAENKDGHSEGKDPTVAECPLSGNHGTLDRASISKDVWSVRYGCDCNKLLVRSKSDVQENTQYSFLESTSPSYRSELLSSNTGVQKFRNLPPKVNKSNELNSDGRHFNLMYLQNRLGHIDPSGAGSHVCARNTDIMRRRTCVANSPAVVRYSANLRIPQNRMHRSRDLNNNDTSYRNVSSYFSAPLFKLQDCFQNQGLLSLAACVTYTFVLMIIFCFIGMFIDSLKSCEYSVYILYLVF